MDGDWIKAIVAVFGVVFAVGGAVSAVLQVKWLREQRKILRGILDLLRAMRHSGAEREPVSQAMVSVQLLKR